MKVRTTRPNVFDRYNAVIDQMLEEGTAYKCYCSKERTGSAARRANGER